MAKMAHDMAVEKIETKEELTGTEIEDIMVDRLTPQEYYDLVSTMITKEVEEHKPTSVVYGEVIMSFILGQDGRLLSKPKVFKGDNPVLYDIGIKSILEAEPFPPFPSSISKNRETFKIAISYE